MERNLDRKTLNFNKGMTNAPSDLLCGDDELEENLGFAFKDGEMHPIRKPTFLLQTNEDYKILFVHKTSEFKNVVAYDEGEKELVIMEYDGENFANPARFQLSDIKDIQSVGNFLIVATGSGLHYYRWKMVVGYVDMGEDLPEPKCQITTTDCKEMFYKDVLCRLTEFYNHGTWFAYYNKETGKLEEIVTHSGSEASSTTGKNYHNYSINQERKTDFDNAVNGCIEEVLKKVKKGNRFCFPFFVRYALKMYDGTYTKISNPILCVPSKKNFKFVPVKEAGDHGIEGETSGQADYFLYMPYSIGLDITAYTDNLEDWSDMVEGITVFVSDEVRPFAAEQEWDFLGAMQSDGQSYATFATQADSNYEWTYGGNAARVVLWPKKYKTDQEIIDELIEKTNFYKLCDIKNGDYNGTYSATGKINSNVVSTLTEQERLDVDDYYGWTKKTANKLYAYNRRLNMMDVRRLPWKGFNEFVTEYHDMDYEVNNCSYYVHIVSETMDAWVKTQGYAGLGLTGTWLYYPDPNAIEMVVAWDDKTGDYTENGRFVVSVKLTKHKRLNGAYYFGRLPKYEERPDTVTQDEPTVNAQAFESLTSQILTSEVNNPFVFEALGDNTVGTGKILNIVANTEAVSQGQFGQYPLIVFTTEGIYAMSVNDEGLYGSIHPISRETCVENSPVVQTGRLVYFVSKKGLMATSGAAVECVSEQMDGSAWQWSDKVSSACTFTEYLQKSMIAYDYKESMLIIISNDEAFGYVYNMKNGTFSVGYRGMTWESVVNDYPDSLLQDSQGNIYSLNRPTTEYDKNTYEGKITTRPLKLGGSLSLKSVRAIKHLVNTKTGEIHLDMYGSNDCRHWQQLSSVGGKPWKYFSFVYTLTGFKAGDTFSGSIVEIQTRREDKMR